MVLWDHFNSPPTRHVPPCLIRGVGIGEQTDPANYPTGVFPQGADDVCPAGQRVVSEARIVEGGKSIMRKTCEPIPLADIKAGAIAANRAECRSRIVSRYSEDRQRSAALGVYGAEYATAVADWIAACVAAENAAADAIDAAVDAAGVAAVVVTWPQ